MCENILYYWRKARKQTEFFDKLKVNKSSANEFLSRRTLKGTYGSNSKKKSTPSAGRTILTAERSCDFLFSESGVCNSAFGKLLE